MLAMVSFPLFGLGIVVVMACGFLALIRILARGKAGALMTVLLGGGDACPRGKVLCACGCAP